MKGLINIDEVIRSVIADNGRNTLHKYIWYLHYALDFVRELNTDYHINVVTKKIKLDNNKGFCFPDDYVSFQSVGIKIGDRIMAFTQDTTLTSYSEKGEINEKFINKYEEKAPYTEIYPYVFYNYKGNNNEFKDLDVYLMGGTYPGYFNIDEKKRRVQLSAEVNEEYVYLEYITSGLKCSEMSVIPEIAIDMAKSYIEWKYARYKFGIASAQSKTWEQEHSRTRDQFLVRKSNLSYASILNSLKRNFSQKVMN